MRGFQNEALRAVPEVHRARCRRLQDQRRRFEIELALAAWRCGTPGSFEDRINLAQNHRFVALERRNFERSGKRGDRGEEKSEKKRAGAHFVSGSSPAR
jgi:hypothetical protein